MSNGFAKKRASLATMGNSNEANALFVHSVGSRKISEQFVSSLLCPWSWLVSEE
jgi:hypothetical protein